MTAFTRKELLELMRLIMENLDSINTDPYNLLSKIQDIMGDMHRKERLEYQKGFYDISFNYLSYEMAIKDNINNIEYKIDRELVDQGKIAPYIIINVANKIEELEEVIIPEIRNKSEKLFIREDLQTLLNSKDKYAFSNYYTNGYITKEDPIKFNKICLELIESFEKYIKGNLVQEEIVTY